MKRAVFRNPWLWVPTLYFAEGIPYVLVNNVSLVMFKNLGVPNGELALYTSLLYLPWVIKPLWSPFVDVLKTKRWWILSMQVVMTVCFALVALSLACFGGNASGMGGVFVVSLILFYITALASATHDIAADGFYMLALDSHRQAQFVGIRSTFYRIATVFGQGVLVMVAGVLERSMESVPAAWSVTLLISATVFALMTMWHTWSLPAPSQDGRRDTALRGKGLLKELASSFVTFFRHKGVWSAILFMLLFRLPEAFSVKMLSPFMLDSVQGGGLGMDTAAVGLAYGTVGVVALTVGGILGGLAAGRWGLRKMLMPMALSLALPCAVYLVMALVQPTSLWFIGACIAFDQFGYGFGFTAYMLYMIWFSRGEFETSHYAICTAFMALSMMLPGMVAGFLQESLGYVGFFWMVMACCVATVLVTVSAAHKVEPEYGLKQ